MTSTAQGIREKINTARSRAIIIHRLDVKRLPFDCARCVHLVRCESLAPSRPVACELSDDDAHVTLPEPREEDWAKCADENADFYLKVHVVGV